MCQSRLGEKYGEPGLQDLFEAVADTLDYGLAVVDAGRSGKYRVLFVNTVLARHFDSTYPEEDLVRRDWRDLFYGESAWGTASALSLIHI